MPSASASMRRVLRVCSEPDGALLDALMHGGMRSGPSGLGAALKSREAAPIWGPSGPLLQIQNGGMNPSDLPLAGELEDAERELEELTAICQALMTSVTDLVDALEVLTLEDSGSRAPLQA